MMSSWRIKKVTEQLSKYIIKQTHNSRSHDSYLYVIALYKKLLVTQPGQ